MTDEDEEIFSEEFVDVDLADDSFQPSEEMSEESSNSLEAQPSASFSNMQVRL